MAAMTDETLKAPFVWFGGKSKVARIVWDHFGDVDNYVEPFAGSLAVLLGRPAYHARRAETVNDLDRYICNFWRALQADPVAVAKYADWPVNETDLTARHIWLVNQGAESLKKLEGNPDYYDSKIAGWWVWGINAWIGSGWCSGTGNWNVDEDGNIVDMNGDGNGIKRQLPHLGSRGQGVSRKLPHLGGGRGVNRQLPHLGDRGQDKPSRETNLDALIDYMQCLSGRLRGVRVCSGDWSRVVTPGALAYGATVGVFLDPPYAASTGRDMTLYTHESDVSDAVREWAIDNGHNPRYRIALCGYQGEHAMPDDWTCVYWKAGASYKSSNGDQNGNRHKERIYFSPGCIMAQTNMF